MSEQILTTGLGARGLLLAAFETNASMGLDELEAKTGLKRDTIKKVLQRHPELFKGIRPGEGIIQWELMPQAPKMVEAVVTSVEMGLGERKEILAQIARWPLPYDAQVTPKQKVEAIAELNKVEGSYAPEKHTDIVITLTGDDLARIYREARSAFLQAGGKPLGLVDGGGDGERPAAGGGDDQVPAVAPPAQGASGDREKR